MYVKGKQEFVSCKDFHQVFIAAESTRMRLKEEILPYWKSFCDKASSQDDSNSATTILRDL